MENIKTDQYGRFSVNTEKRIRKWMELNKIDYDNSTCLAEACADDMGIYENGEYKISERLFELASDAMPDEFVESPFDDDEDE